MTSDPIFADPMLQWLGQPIAASAHAGQIDQTMALVHWLMLVLFVGWSAFFIYVLMRFRRSRHPVANYHGVRGWWSNLAEAGVLVAEVVLIAFFSVPIWSSRVDALPSEREATVVRIIAEQFSWNIHYPGADGRFGRTDITLVDPDNPIGLDRDDPAGKDDITSINQFNMPIDKPVLVFLSSKDVVHSLGLPQMRVKQDAIPGIVQPVWFTPTITGQWDIACSQLCGLGHAQMRGLYKVMTAEEYQAWLDEEAEYLEP
jgi:cytochrome c oxidase subunit 2